MRSVLWLAAMLMRTSRPRRRVISCAFSDNNLAVPPPTVPIPKMPILIGCMLTPCYDYGCAKRRFAVLL